MNRFHSFLSLLTIAMILPGVAMAGNTCDQLCGATTDSVKKSITDPKCKASSTCMDCVAKSVVGGQQGVQCQAYGASKKSANKQTISTALYLATGITCGISCFITMTPYGKGLQQPLSKACGGLGLAASAADVLGAISSGDMAGGMMGAIGSLATAKNSISMVKNGVTSATHTVQGESIKQAKSMVCMNAGIYLATSVMKAMSQKKMKDSQGSSCGNIQNLAGTDSPVQACLASAGSVQAPSTALAGIYAATAESYPTVKVDDVNRSDATAGKTGQFMKDMKGDLETAVSTGKVDLNDIAKRLDKGEDVSSIIAGAGLPEGLTGAVKDFEEKAKAGGKSDYLASLSGGGYSSSGTATAATGDKGDSGSSELAYGHSGGVTPGEGATELEVEQKPSTTEAQSVGIDGDVFHGAYSGTIFDIVTSRLKAQKGNYAELDPEGRMNRLFNGFGESGAKGARSPASINGQSAH